jgi:hypothetical protein
MLFGIPNNLRNGWQNFERYFCVWVKEMLITTCQISKVGDRSTLEPTQLSLDARYHKSLRIHQHLLKYEEPRNRREFRFVLDSNPSD